MTTISGLTALGATPANGDLLPLTDVSDTTQSANGTTKKVTVAELVGSVINDKNILHPLGGYTPNSARTAASLVSVTSSDSGSDKPVFFGRSFTKGDGWQWEFTVTQAFTTATLKILYYMDTANTSKAVIFGCKVAAISSGDASVTAKAFAAANTTTQSVPNAIGTEDLCSITITNNDSMAVGDRVVILVYRDTAAGDTATGEPVMTFGYVQYA